MKSDEHTFPSDEARKARSINVTDLRIKTRELVEKVFFNGDILFGSVFGRNRIAIIRHDPTDPEYRRFMQAKGIIFDENGKPITENPRR